MTIYLVMLIFAIVSSGCMEPVSAQSSVYVYAESNGGEFTFFGDGAEWNFDINVDGFDIANVDLRNHWDYSSSTVVYNNIGDGEIHLRVSDRNFHNPFYYYDWEIIQYDGNGHHRPLYYSTGGRSVNVTDSENVTTFIEQVTGMRKATFLMDTRHTKADLTVIVHNGHLIENATVELIGGPHKVGWTDENGEVELTPSTGKYALLIETENFSSMLVEDLMFEADKLYIIRVNMTDCLSSCGSPFCAPDSDDLVMYYKEKDPNMGAITPQSYVDYFADRLTTCMAGRDNSAVGTLERMATQWGVYPTNLGVLLYSCEFEKNVCDEDWCEWEIEYTVKNFQQHPHNYVVTLIVGNTTTELGTGTLGATWSSTAKKTFTEAVIIDGCGHDPGCAGNMYLIVTSKRAD